MTKLSDTEVSEIKEKPHISDVENPAKPRMQRFVVSRTYEACIDVVFEAESEESASAMADKLIDEQWSDDEFKEMVTFPNPCIAELIEPAEAIGGIMIGDKYRPSAESGANDVTVLQVRPNGAEGTNLGFDVDLLDEGEGKFTIPSEELAEYYCLVGDGKGDTKGKVTTTSPDGRKVAYTRADPVMTKGVHDFGIR